MSSRMSKWVMVVTMAVILTLLGTMAVHAQGDTDMVVGDWVPMDNEPHWFSFVVGHEDGEPFSYVTVSLLSQPAGGAQFKLFRPQEASFWGEPERDSWFGASAETDTGDAEWTGYLVPGAYYARLEPLGTHECCFSVSGQAVQNVTFIDLSPYVPPANEPVMAESPVMPTTPAAAPALMAIGPTTPSASSEVTTSAEGAEMAMEPGQWMPITDHDPHWFSFYVGRVEDEAAVPVTIYTAAKPDGGLPFEVYAGARIDPYATPEEGDWIGLGQEVDTGEYTWYGSLAPGSYAVRIAPSSAPECLLVISGQAVTW